MNLVDYCEYNARKAWAKRAPFSAAIHAPPEPVKPPPPVDTGTRVEEHAPDSTSGVHVRAVHEAMLRAREGL